MKRVISIVLCLVLALSLCGCEKMDYNKAVELYEAGGYEGAKAAFEALGDYEDSAEYAAKAQLVLDYRNAIELYAEEKYSEAAEAFEALGEYEDSAEYLAKLQDKLLLEKITGRWQTEEIDMTNLILGSIKEEMAALGYDEINFDDVDKLSYSVYYTFEDYGVVNQELVEESYTDFFISVAYIIKDTIIKLSEQEIAAVAEAYGMALEDVYAALGVADIHEYMESTLGMSLDEFLSLIYTEESFNELLEASIVNGAWYLRDGVIYIVAGHDVEKASYDPETDTITVEEIELDDPENEEFSQEEASLIYPYTMSRAGTTNLSA